MATRSLTTNQKLGYAYAVGYAGLGFLGFAVTGGTDFASSEGAKVLGVIGLNPFSNGLHLLAALVFLIGAASGYVGARGTNVTMGLILAAWGVLGFILGTGSANIFAATAMTNILHLVSGGILVAVGNKKDYPAPQTPTRASFA